MTTKQHIDDFRAKVSTRAFNAARALIERELTGAIAAAATKEFDRARDAWIPLQGAQDNEAKWKAWLIDERKNHAELDALVGDAGGEADAQVVDNADGWSTIDTAPKDGTVVDLWHPDSGRSPDCSWSEDPKDKAKSGWVQQEVPGAGTSPFTPGWLPTHWRHVPADPVQA